MKVHHSRTHGNTLPNRTCSNCEIDFYCEYENKYCSENCRQQSQSFEGKSNPNYRGKKQSTDCLLCGESFQYYESAKEGLYCSDCVENESWRDVPELRGEQNPRWKCGKRQLNCEVCDSSLARYPSEISGNVVLCSEECRTDWLSEQFTQSGHPNWKGGGNGSYGSGWNATRRQALERDGYECARCSKPKDEIGRNPDVHHIIPVRLFAESDNHKKEDAHFLDNVVSLCISCHRKADFGKIQKTKLKEFVISS
nr:HNH endonuclease [Halorussus pelagicus]